MVRDDGKEKSSVHAGIENYRKVASLIAVTLAFAIYCFASGYSESLGIPDFPSITGSTRFFVANMFSTMATTWDWGERLNWVGPVSLVILGIAFLLSSLKSLFSNTSKPNVKIACWKRIGAIFLLVPYSKGILSSLPYTFAVVLPTSLTVVTFLHWVEAEKQFSRSTKSGVNHRVIFLTVTALLVWIYPYIFGKSLIHLAFWRPAYPTVASKNSDNQELLLWVDGEHRYFLNCLQSIVRGEMDDSKVVSYRYANSDVKRVICDARAN